MKYYSLSTLGINTLRGGIAVTAVLAIGLTVQAASHAGSESAPVIGSAAPSFSGLTSGGETISLDQFADKMVVLEWTNHDCPFVRKHYNSGNMQATQQVAADDEDIVWISVISSAPGKQGHVSAEDANALTTSRGAVPDYVILDEDGVIGQAYAAKTTPHMFVIDDRGALQYDGAMDDKRSASVATIEGATNYTLNAINAVKAGDPVDPAKTKPYGCSVKYGS